MDFYAVAPKLSYFSGSENFSDNHGQMQSEPIKSDENEKTMKR
jgi:hypothetical protein